jgi:hypothetical protein
VLIAVNVNEVRPRQALGGPGQEVHGRRGNGRGGLDAGLALRRDYWGAVAGCKQYVPSSGGSNRRLIGP